MLAPASGLVARPGQAKHGHRPPEPRPRHRHACLCAARQTRGGDRGAGAPARRNAHADRSTRLRLDSPGMRAGPIVGRALRKEKYSRSAEIRRFGGTGLLPAGAWSRDFVGGTAHQLELALGRGFPVRWDWNESAECGAFRVRGFECQPALIESAPEPRTRRRHRTPNPPGYAFRIEKLPVGHAGHESKPDSNTLTNGRHLAL